MYTIEYYSATEKNEVLPFVTQMDLDGVMLSEISQREANTLWFHLYVQSKQQMDTDNGLVTARGKEGWGGGGGAKWVTGVKRYRLPVTKSVSHGYVQRGNYSG